jgi:hypothetical protein
MTGIFLGLLFFPSSDFSKSLLVGVIFNKNIFNEIFTNSLLFWAFLLATFFPAIIDLFFLKKKIFI